MARADGDSTGCRMVVDGVVKAELISQEVTAFALCRSKAA